MCYTLLRLLFIQVIGENEDRCVKLVKGNYAVSLLYFIIFVWTTFILIYPLTYKAMCMGLDNRVISIIAGGDVLLDSRLFCLRVAQCWSWYRSR